MLELINYFKINEELKNKVIDLAHKDKVKLLYAVEEMKKDNFDCLLKFDHVFRLAAVIEYAYLTKKQYASLGIDDAVFIDTMDDIRIWCENNNNKGLKNVGWIKNHLNCQLFKLGRLQFQMYQSNDSRLDYSRLPFDRNENLIAVHIPQGERLDYTLCLGSIASAIVFFDTYFPDYDYRFFFCESWLLYDENWRFMKSSSNIMQFSSLFDIVYSCDDDSQAIERIFGHRRFFKKNYPNKTTLQKSAIDFMLKGGKLGYGIGVIEKKDFSYQSD